MYYEKDRSSTQYLSCEKVNNLNFGLHIHASFELVYVIDGSVRCIVGNSGFDVNSGEAIIILPNIPHSYLSSGSLSITVIFSQNYVNSFSRTIKRQNFISPVFHLDHPEILDKLETQSFIMQKAVLYYMCAQALEKCEITSSDRTVTGAVQGIIDYVEQNYLSPISLHGMSAYLGYNAGYVSRLINVNFNMNFRGLVNSFRISHSVELLENTDHQITEIALECGFNDLRSFNRAFEKHMNTTPSEYRKVYKKTTEN